LLLGLKLKVFSIKEVKRGFFSAFSRPILSFLGLNADIPLKPLFLFLQTFDFNLPNPMSYRK